MPLNRSDLLEHLEEQMEFLRTSCAAYDSGKIKEHKRIAVTLRVLLHDTRMSHSVLNQLGVKTQLIYTNTATPFFVNTETEFRSNFGVTMMSYGGDDISYVPILGDYPMLGKDNTNTSFDAWWEEKLMEGEQGDVLTRKSAVLDVANTDGGAHVGEILPSGYEQLSRREQFGFRHIWYDGDEPGYNSPIPATVRQVAYELLDTIEKNKQLIYSGSV